VLLTQLQVRGRIAFSAVILALAGSLSVTARAEPRAGDEMSALPDLRARVAAFRQALSAFAREQSLPPELVHDGGLTVTTRYQLRPDFFEDLDGPIGVPGRPDFLGDEELFINGREEDYESAARHWVGRRLKGSDSRKRGPRRKPKPTFAWDHGPIVGVGVGPVSARAGEDQWSVRWRTRRRLSNGGPWSSKISIGEKDGEFVAAVLFGRSILDAHTR
jgi:hypothetical protein